MAAKRKKKAPAKKPMTKAARSKKLSALAKKRLRYKTGPKKGQFKKGR